MAETWTSPCLCEALRRASRTITRAYDDALRPVGLRLSQFSILVALVRHDDVRVRDLAADLLLDDSTMTRNLRPLEQRGLLTLRAGDDRREKWVALTRSGRALFARATPLWVEVQEQMKERLPGTTFETAMRVLPKLAG